MSAHWDELARELEIKSNYRAELRVKKESADLKLEFVLEKWIRNETCEVTWQKLIDAVTQLGRKDIAKVVMQYVDS